MNNKQKKQLQESIKIRKKIYEKKRKCFSDSCDATAINSHILQKNGIIKSISEYSHVYRYLFDPFKGGINFKRIGNNEAFSIKGFCNKHDTEIFSEIEQVSFDPNDYRVQLLFSYRSLLYEYRKKEFMLEWYSIIYEKNQSNLSEEKENFLISSMFGLQLGIGAFQPLLKDIEDNLKVGNVETYKFKTKMLNFLPVCFSTIFPIESEEASLSKEGDKNEMEELANLVMPTNDMIVNLFPYSDKSCLIIGFHKDYSKKENYNILNELDQKQDKDFEQLVSNILLINSETWICSPKFYREKIIPKEGLIKSYILANFNNNFWSYDGNINLFD